MKQNYITAYISHSDLINCAVTRQCLFEGFAGKVILFRKRFIIFPHLLTNFCGETIFLEDLIKWLNKQDHWYQLLACIIFVKTIFLTLQYSCFPKPFHLHLNLIWVGYSFCSNNIFSKYIYAYMSIDKLRVIG